MRSLLITALHADAASGQILIDGAGLGHGVGMCQWGAQGMALGGRRAEEILALYFPGTQIGSD